MLFDRQHFHHNGKPLRYYSAVFTKLQVLGKNKDGTLALIGFHPKILIP